MTNLQTCRRHPEAGRFMRTCFRCARELYDIGQANRARTAAQDALATYGVAPDARILSAAFVGDALIVATAQPGAYFKYGVDTFRLPTASETDPDQTDPRTPGEWVLVDSAGAHTEADVPRLVRETTDYLRQIGLAPQKAAA